MQWDRSKNFGFSEAEKEELYLPQDPSEDAPCVSAQENDPDSLLAAVRSVIALRHAKKDLQADADFSVLCDDPGRPFVYRRGSLILTVNPSGNEMTYVDPALTGCRILYSIGKTEIYDDAVILGGSSFAVFER